MVALENRCCHRHAPLSRGRKEGDDLRCMYHGLKFAPSGKCIEIPQQDIIPSTAVVRSYPVVEQDCWMWVWMGDPALAERALIPRALNHNDPDWLTLTGELAYDANYELINDNLLDLSHLSYVHQSTLGRNSMSWGESRPRTTRLQRGLRIERCVVNHHVRIIWGCRRGPCRICGRLTTTWFRASSCSRQSPTRRAWPRGAAC